MEHPADIRHRASLLLANSFCDGEFGCEIPHADLDEIHWAEEAIGELLDEIVRLNKLVTGAENGWAASRERYRETMRERDDARRLVANLEREHKAACDRASKAEAELVASGVIDP